MKPKRNNPAFFVPIRFQKQKVVSQTISNPLHNMKKRAKKGYAIVKIDKKRTRKTSS